MPFYLAPYIGAGIGFDSFRPRGSDQVGWSAADIRPDGGRTLDGGGLNACLLHLPLDDPDPLLFKLALDPDDTLGPVLRRAIQTRLGLANVPASTRWRDLAMELLLTPPVNGWKPIRPTVQGFYEVWLGGLLKRMPVLAGGTSISENWNCADSASLTCNLTWTEVEGTAWEILTNAARRAGGSGWNTARADSDLATADHEVQVTVTAEAQTGGTLVAAGPIARKDATATLEFYGWWFVLNDATNEHRLTKLVAGAETVLQTAVDDFTLNEVLKVQPNGSTIKGFIGGVEKASVVDGAITGGLRGGIRGYGDGASADVSVDAWSAADLVAAGVTYSQLERRVLRGVGRGILIGV